MGVSHSSNQNKIVGIQPPEKNNIKYEEIQKIRYDERKKQKFDNKNIVKQFNLIFYISNEEGIADIIGNDSAPGDVQIPTYIEHEGKQFTIISIFKNSFRESRTIRSINFSDDSKILIIGEFAFYGSSIESIIFPSSLFHIENLSFYDCCKLKQVQFPSNSNLKIIGVSAFDSTSIENVKIPSSVTEIWLTAFCQCKHLKTVEFSTDSKLQQIDTSAFSYTSIENISIPSSVTEIGSHSFENCIQLKTIEIPIDSKLQKIGEYFIARTQIESISIPSNVIFDEFWNCASKLTEIILIPNKINNHVYYNNNKNIIISKSNQNQDNYDVLTFVYRHIKSFTAPSFIIL